MMESSLSEPHVQLNYSYIENNNRFSSYLKLLEEKKIATLSLDIEAENNLHSYGQKLCLVQVFDGTQAALIDPFRVSPSLLKCLFENRDILKVMYGASSDIVLLKNTLNISLKSVLDLYPAAVLLHLKKQDLYSVILSELGITLKNKNRFQTHNWKLRPISGLALDYAVNDVAYLLRLKDALMDKLYEKKLLESYLLRNLKIQNKDITRKPGINYYKFAGYQELQQNKKAVAQKVIEAIDKYAASYDMPFDTLFRKTDVIEIVKDPGHLDKMKFPKNLSDSCIQVITGELQNIING